MDHAALVRIVDSPGQSLDKGGGFAGRPWRAVEPLGKAASIDIFQDQVRAAGVLADLKNLHDIRMLQTADRLGLGPKPRPIIRRVWTRGLKHLECDQALELDLTSPVGDAHASPAELVKDLITRRARGERGCGFAPGRDAG
jgi:hypothetical protein